MAVGRGRTKHLGGSWMYCGDRSCPGRHPLTRASRRPTAWPRPAGTQRGTSYPRLIPVRSMSWKEDSDTMAVRSVCGQDESDSGDGGEACRVIISTEDRTRSAEGCTSYAPLTSARMRSETDIHAARTWVSTEGCGRRFRKAVAVSALARDTLGAGVGSLRRQTGRPWAL
jgi:hypothetical protein